MLAGRYPDAQAIPADARAARQPGPNNIYADRVTRAGVEMGQRFATLAREHGKTPGQLALLWCKDQPGVTSPILGPRTMEQLTELLPVLDMSLTPAVPGGRPGPIAGVALAWRAEGERRLL